MTAQRVYEILLAILPSLMTICTVIAVIWKVIKEFVALKKQVTDMKDLKDVKMQLNAVLQENYELKKTLKETMTKIDHVKRD